MVAALVLCRGCSAPRLDAGGDSPRCCPARWRCAAMDFFPCWQQGGTQGRRNNPHVKCKKRSCLSIISSGRRARSRALIRRGKADKAALPGRQMSSARSHGTKPGGRRCWGEGGRVFWGLGEPSPAPQRWDPLLLTGFGRWVRRCCPFWQAAEDRCVCEAKLESFCPETARAPALNAKQLLGSRFPGTKGNKRGGCRVLSPSPQPGDHSRGVTAEKGMSRTPPRCQALGILIPRGCSSDLFLRVAAADGTVREHVPAAAQGVPVPSVPPAPACGQARGRALRAEVAEADPSSSGSSVISFQEQITFPAAKDMVDFNKNGNSQQTEPGAGRAVVASPRCCQGSVALMGEAGYWWVAAGQRRSCPRRAGILVLSSRIWPLLSPACALPRRSPQQPGPESQSCLFAVS